MRPQKVPFVEFCLIDFLFQMNDRIFNGFNIFFAFGILVVSDVVDRSINSVSTRL